MINIREALNTYKTVDQIVKVLVTIIVCMLLLVGVEILFQIPVIQSYLSIDMLENKTGYLLWMGLWILLFLQCTILPIPPMPIYIFCNSSSLVPGTALTDLASFDFLVFVIISASACTVGAISAYWLGRSIGKKAVKWVAGSEEDYDKWSKFLNKKWGKIIYFLTALLPIFPDDLLCIVVGSTKMDFGFFCITNILTRTLGIICSFIIFRLPFIGSFLTSGTTGGIPWALIIYSAITLASLILLVLFNRKRVQLAKMQ